MRKIIILSVLVLLFQAGVVLYGAIPAKERAALIALYNATDGDNWDNNYGWKAEPLEPDGFGPIGSEDNWRGITVSGDHVSYIMLGGNNLTGSLPPELGNLKYLYFLSLGSNQLTSIPPELGNLSVLNELSLSNNQLTGGIPPELGNLYNLENLFLENNQLTAIPPGLENLGNLERLRLCNNQLTSIPPELENLKNLIYLDLSDNQLIAIPPELGNMESLHKLDLYNNQLTAIPPELGNLAVLSHLHLSINQLTVIPPELGNLKNLVHLCLGANQLTSIPPELGNLVYLDELYLHNNQLTTIPPELGNLGNLRSLFLMDNKLTGAIPPELGNLSNLYYLNLSGNKLSGSIPIELMKLSYFLYECDLSYNALYTNDEDLKLFLDGKDEDWDETQTVAPASVLATVTADSSIRLIWTPIKYTDDSGAFIIYYSNASGGPWMLAGQTSDKETTTYTVTGLDTNTPWYFMIKTQTDPHSENPNTVISETTTPAVTGGGTSFVPFGFMETPSGETVVGGSIPVTGWALDDYGIESVKIYREENQDQVYIGDALFVAGARPDIEEAYPTYPNNHKAGWGYMLLTNFLPNGGNGTFKLKAVASDFEGKHTTLGTVVITCDNANAVKPFGAIDTPVPGGTASGGNYRNQGWVLTPMPNTIPVDGSTIDVYIDGVFRGRPVYNVYRPDIAALFPGYANSDGALAYFDFDTTAYADSVHTIQWNVTDDAGNSEGIGSRYFTIKNAGNTRRSGIRGKGSGVREGVEGAEQGENVSHADVPVDYVSPVEVKKGYHREAVMRDILPDENGVRTIQINPLQRITIGLDNDHSPFNTHHSTLSSRRSTPKNTSSIHYTGYSIVGNQLRPIPIGSTLDAERGVFYWSPGVGFIGTYRLVFIGTSADGDMIRKHIDITIAP